MLSSDLLLTTREDAKAYLDLTEDTWDSVIEAEIDAVTVAIEVFCNRTFLRRTLTAEKIDGPQSDEWDSTELQLRYPIISITSITNDTVSVVETTNYEMYPDSGLVVLTDGTGWAGGHKKITITYSYGYERDDLPGDIVSAANLWVMKRLKDIQEKRVGVTSVTKGDQTISYEKGMPTEVKRLIEPYVIVLGGWTA
jgi:hypothetical protein